MTCRMSRIRIRNKRFLLSNFLIFLESLTPENDLRTKKSKTNRPSLLKTKLKSKIYSVFLFLDRSGGVGSTAASTLNRFIFKKMRAQIWNLLVYSHLQSFLMMSQTHFSFSFPEERDADGSIDFLFVRILFLANYLQKISKNRILIFYFTPLLPNKIMHQD